MKFKILILFTIVCFCKTYAQEYEVNFNKEYIKENDENVSIEINEIQELIYIIFANTEFAKENPRMVKTDTEYYNKMIEHFSEYSDLPIVKKFDSLLEENLLYYFVLAGNAYGYKFKHKNIVPTGIYDFPAKGVGNLEVESNPIPELIKDLEQYAEKSKYRKFFKQKKEYYSSLKTDYQNYAQIDLQTKWLQNRFDYRINSFRVLTSPLISSMNATQTFEDNDFKETLLFLPTIKNNEALSKKYNKAINTRVIFTEIDHNYVGKVSEKFTESIDSIFGEREKWVDVNNKGTQYYPTPIKVFDEYLTWGLFILYAYDNYEQETLSEVTDNINGVLIERGFPKAKEFNSRLLEIYKVSENAQMSDLYPDILEWCAQQ
ncbi:DUF4932 domain-containing protein [Cellulophaga sp. HaHa_2_95]|uniref:DUF4932 domain-containing protein n=1 Tax=Cellulophaga sp. HaHa_2_95 TaxID=2745558 RepID=UPI001C4E68A9|nr:DUF4932 domain-containing protein [Cellulophaga sp. HaHa_2_95]QXP55100.1 DUF4932 domain-containing protein [Cellulophaga sp. HaHa_2_95]